MRRTASPPALPADIRLMNLTAAVLAAIGVLALVGMLALWVVRQPVFAVRGIRIEGDLAHNSVLTIRANATPRLAGNFYTLDLAAARRAFEAVPWVRQAVVKRVWPNRLSVRLEEHRPVALWAEPSRSGAGDADANAADDKLVNSHGEVFEANLGDVEDDALPTLRGPEGSAPHMLALLARLQPVFDTLDVRIEALELSGRGSWRAELDSGAQVELGRGDDDEVIARTQVFAATLTQVTQRYQRSLQYADLRHSEGYAVRLKGVSTSTDGAAKPARK
ncbi:MAG: FtsQ-type POTRA domain-containing protein [Rhizobacter sp.]|nr:FtsQ-type POTRA domain-containing protein [Rhizobacter sp.]